jgi:hypothetical protein
MDWSSWAQRVEPILWSGGPTGEFRALFAPGATYADPVNEETEDLEAIEQMTRGGYPDWRQVITSAHGDDRGGAFEWVGTGNLGGKTPMEIHGCTIVSLDRDGLITRWRDYFDVKEIEKHLRTTIESAADSVRGS